MIILMAVGFANAKFKGIAMPFLTLRSVYF